MSGRNTELTLWHKKGCKKRHATDVVKMGMGQKDIDIQRTLGDQFIAEIANAGTGIKNNDAITTTHLEARRVAAIAHCTGTRAGNTATHTPELY